MNKKIIISVLALGALVVATVSGVLLYNTASASGLVQRGFVPRVFQTGTFQTGPDQDFRGPGGRGGPGGATQEQLANALGITTDQLTAAYEKANQAALDQAVSKGLITQAQADQLKQNGQAFPFGGRWQGYLSQNGIDYDALLANALGISTDQLQAARLKAQDAAIDQAVADGRLTQEQADLMKAEQALYNNAKFQASVKTAFEDAVKQAVSDGVITQAQADAILARQNTMGGHGFGMFGGGPGDFGGHGGRGHGGFGPGFPGMNPPSGAPQQPSNSNSNSNGL